MVRLRAYSRSVHEALQGRESLEPSGFSFCLVKMNLIIHKSSQKKCDKLSLDSLDQGWQPEFPEFENDTMGRSFLQNKVRSNSSSIQAFTALGCSGYHANALFLWTFQQVSWLDDGDDGLADICKACQSLPSCFAHENRPLAYLWLCKACAPCTMMPVGSNFFAGISRAR